MGTISRAYFTGANDPKNQIRIDGIGLKESASEQDVELWQAILGTGNPVMITASDSILCQVTSGMYTSDKGGIKIRMQGDDGEWTNQVDVN